MRDCTCAGGMEFSLPEWRGDAIAIELVRRRDLREHQFFRYFGNLRLQNSFLFLSFSFPPKCSVRAFDPWLHAGTIKIPDGSSIGMRLRTILLSYLLLILFKSYILSRSSVTSFFLSSLSRFFLSSFLYIEGALFAIWRTSFTCFMNIAWYVRASQQLNLLNIRIVKSDIWF